MSKIANLVVIACTVVAACGQTPEAPGLPATAVALSDADYPPCHFPFWDGDEPVDTVRTTTKLVGPGGQSARVVASCLPGWFVVCGSGCFASGSAPVTESREEHPRYGRAWISCQAVNPSPDLTASVTAWIRCE